MWSRLPIVVGVFDRRPRLGTAGLTLGGSGSRRELSQWLPGFFWLGEVKPHRLLVAAYGCFKHLLVALDAQPFPVRAPVMIPGGELSRLKKLLLIR